MYADILIIYSLNNYTATHLFGVKDILTKIIII